MKNQAKNPLQWLSVSEEDFSAATFLLEGKPDASSVICFLCQQASEKILKGYLCVNGREIPRTHDLKMLCALCLKIDPSFSEILVPSARLTIYAVKIRYPHGYILTPEIVRTATEDANFIRKFVDAKIRQLISLK